MIVTRDEYYSLLAKIESIPFLQSQAWIETNYLNNSAKVVYFVNDNKDIRICCVGSETKRRFFGTKLNINGICRKSDVNETEMRKFLLSIVEMGYDAISVRDCERYDSEFELAIRRAGFIRPLGLALSPMTLYVELQKPFSFHRNWRRNVKKSIENGNTFSYIEKPSQEDADDFVHLFKEQSERKGLRYGFSSKDIMRLLEDSRYQMVMVKNKDGVNIAGRMLFISGDMAYDVYAANSYEGINSGGVYQVQEGMLKHLQTTGAKYFDYGLIPPRADEMDAIYLSKSYSGGFAVGLNGEWQFGKSLFKEYIRSFLTYCVRKNKIY